MLSDRRGRLFPAYVLIKIPRLGGFLCQLKRWLALLCVVTRGMKGRELGVWSVGFRDPIPTCVGMTKGQIFTGLPRLRLAMTRVMRFIIGGGCVALHNSFSDGTKCGKTQQQDHYRNEYGGCRVWVVCKRQVGVHTVIANNNRGDNQNNVPGR